MNKSLWDLSDFEREMIVGGFEELRAADLLIFKSINQEQWKLKFSL